MIPINTQILIETFPITALMTLRLILLIHLVLIHQVLIVGWMLLLLQLVL